MSSTSLPRLLSMLRQVSPTNDTAGSQRLGLEFLELAGPGIQNEMVLESLDLLNFEKFDQIDSQRQFLLESIVMPFYRPVIDIVHDRIIVEQLTSDWKRLGNTSVRSRIEECLLSVGRIDVPKIPYAGTGFVVGQDLLMTNRHVAAIFATGVGTRKIEFHPGPAVDFYHEIGQDTSETLEVQDVLMIHPFWDMALLKVSGLAPRRKPLVLSTVDPSTLDNATVCVVGYPGFDPRGDSDFQAVQNRIFRGTYYVKRLQPGRLRLRERIESYENMVDAITHDCSTLGGNSGSAVLVVPEGPDQPIEVVGLHFAGEYLKANYAVPTYDLAQDQRVVDQGVCFGPGDRAHTDVYQPIWRMVQDAEVLSSEPSNPAAVPQMNSIRVQTNGSVTLSIPLHITVSVGTPTVVPQAGPIASPMSDSKGLKISAEGMFSRKAMSNIPWSDFSIDSLNKSSFDWTAGLSCGLASKLSYSSDPVVCDTAKTLWGFSDCEFVEASHTQCFVAWSDRVVLMAFRGTESFGDWLGNLDVVSSHKRYGIVHRGFLNAFIVVETRLRNILNELPGRTIVLTGHSLGGAVATIAAAHWSGSVPIQAIYTYGQPAVGKSDFPEFMRTTYPTNFFRFVNDDDVVPRVPPTYRHVGQLIWFDAKGRVRSRATAPATAPATESLDISGDHQMLSQEEFKRLQSALRSPLVSQPNRGLESTPRVELEGFVPSVRDHSMDEYLSQIALNTPKQHE